MADAVATTHDDARDAVARGAWDEALRLLDEAGDADDPDLLALRAEAAYGAGNLEATVTAWERIHTLRRDHDPVGAAQAAATVAMYMMMDSGLMAPVRAWLARADLLLDGRPDGPAHALIALVRTYERFMSGDAAGAGTQAERAIELGRAYDVPPAVAIGRVAAGRLRIYAGHVDEGLAALDDVAVSLLAGEYDDLTTGMVWCELICAMQGLALYDRADQWTAAMERWRHGAAVGGIHGRCLVHRAEILRLRGDPQAEDEALAACDALRPWMRREFGWPLTELGTVRLLKGDLAGAEEAFLAAHEHVWEPHPGLALLRLEQGRVEEAAELITAALEHPRRIPSKERPPFGPLWRAPLLDARVEIALRRDDTATARSAADELRTIATAFRSPALLATSRLAAGRVALAEGDLTSAASACEQAVAGWSDIGAPFETASARLVLADVREAAGDRAAAELERRAALATFERVGAHARARVLRERLASETHADPVTPDPAVTTAVFQRHGDTRTLRFADVEVQVADLKGMRHLAHLLAAPGRDLHVLQLVALDEGRDPATVLPPVSGNELIDDEAREAYRRRLEDIQEDLDEAERLNDAGRAELAARDREYLLTELQRAIGLGGRPRRDPDATERARTAVTRAVRYALGRIREHHPALADHLDRTVQTGTSCCYDPDPRAPIEWVT